MRDIDNDRVFVEYSDVKEMSRKIDALSNKLSDEGKTVQVSTESVDGYAQAVDWSNKDDVRELLRNILRKHKGVSVQFQYGEQYATAYLTKDGINHAVGGPASGKKAAAFAVYCDLIRKAEYCFSSKNDPHSKRNKKIPGKSTGTVLLQLPNLEMAHTLWYSKSEQSIWMCGARFMKLPQQKRLAAPTRADSCKSSRTQTRITALHQSPMIL